MLRKFLDRGAVSLIDRAVHAQAPLVDKYTGWVRRTNPGASAEQIIDRMERHYLIAVTSSGVLVGLTAAVPGIGTLVGLAAAGADSVFFLEASAVFTLGATSVRRVTTATALDEHMVTAVVLGQAGAKALGSGASRSARQWDLELARRLPGLSDVRESPVKRFVVQFVIRRTVLGFGKVVPAGIGAVIGGVGNNAMGRAIVAAVHRSLEHGASEAPEAGLPVH
ncbi:hypothetical protein [Nocardia sp. NPDC005366]|uniref:hypothetical protein n=1 Tax=Nocardia sp. NPDC005366 TaxID=3156878 RepID=UPI0033ACD054